MGTFRTRCLKWKFCSPLPLLLGLHYIYLLDHTCAPFPRIFPSTLLVWEDMNSPWPCISDLERAMWWNLFYLDSLSIPWLFIPFPSTVWIYTKNLQIQFSLLSLLGLSMFTYTLATVSAKNSLLAGMFPC